MEPGSIDRRYMIAMANGLKTNLRIQIFKRDYNNTSQVFTENYIEVFRTHKITSECYSDISYLQLLRFYRNDFLT